MFIYSVYYYDDLNEKMASDKGLVSAATFEEATEKWLIIYTMGLLVQQSILLKHQKMVMPLLRILMNFLNLLKLILRRKNKMMFAYEVKSLSGYSDDEVEIDVGVISASSMADASKIIENYYEDLLISANLTYLNRSSHNMVLLGRIKDHFNITNTANS